jgi:hypothetical protein
LGKREYRKQEWAIAKIFSEETQLELDDTEKI